MWILMISLHDHIHLTEQVLAVDDRGGIHCAHEQLVFLLFEEVPCGEIQVHFGVGRVCSTRLRSETIFKQFCSFSSPCTFDTPERSNQLFATIGELLLHGEGEVDFVHAPA